MTNQTIKSYSDFAFEIPDTIFMDPDGESLVLNLFLKNGSDVPPWIKFTPENRLVYGTQNSADTSVNLKIVATDPKSSTVATFFTVFITKNKAPLAVNEISTMNVFMNLFFLFQIPDNVFRDEDNDYLTYSLVPFDGEAIPPWIKFVEANRTLLGAPKDREGETFKFKVQVDDGRHGQIFQVIYMKVNPNYNIAKLGPLIIIGILPMIGMFAFVFTLGFAKVPALPQDQMMDSNEKPDFDSCRFLLDQRNKARRRAEKLE
jgi:hypothetical protein